MDYFAIASLGTFPTPTPTASERMAYAVSYGLLDSLAETPAPSGPFSMGLTLDLD